MLPCVILNFMSKSLSTYWYANTPKETLSWKAACNGLCWRNTLPQRGEWLVMLGILSASSNCSHGLHYLCLFDRMSVSSRPWDFNNVCQLCSGTALWFYALVEPLHDLSVPAIKSSLSMEGMRCVEILISVWALLFMQEQYNCLERIKPVKCHQETNGDSWDWGDTKKFSSRATGSLSTPNF